MLNENFLVELLGDYIKAKENFESCPERFFSSQVSPEASRVINIFFGVQQTLTDYGCGLASKASDMSSLEAAVYRWAIWQKTAEHTATLNLTMPGNEDSAIIMERLGLAEEAMRSASSKSH